MQMGKVPAHARQLVDLDQQVGDPDPAKQLVGAAAKLLCLGRHGSAQGSDRQAPMAQSHIGELVVGQQACHLRHRLVDLIAPLLEIRLARGLDCDRDRLSLAQFAPGRLGEQVLVEGPILAAARHPHIASAQTVAQGAQRTQLIEGTVDSAGHRDDVRLPARGDELDRCV